MPIDDDKSNKGLPFDHEWVTAGFKGGQTSPAIPQTPSELLAGVCGLLQEVLAGKLSPELAKAKVDCALKLLNELRSRTKS